MPNTVRRNLSKRFVKNVKGLSTVVTTLIILVVSVLLATVVTYYAMNIVSTRVIEEDGRITQLHVWVNCTSGNCTTAQAALVFKATGGRDILIDKVTVRYQDIPWGNIYYYVARDSITEDATYNCTLADGGNVTFGQTTKYTVHNATSEICMKTGESIIIYIEAPNTLDCLDIGTPIPIGVHTSNAIYYKESNVEAVT